MATPSQLRIFLSEHLALADIPSFTETFFDLDHEKLAGQAKGDKVRELVAWCSRHGKLELLEKLCATIQLFSTRFDLSELSTLAFDLGITLENHAGGTGRPSQVVKIMVVLWAEGRFGDLAEWLRKNRRDITPPAQLQPRS